MTDDDKGRLAAADWQLDIEIQDQERAEEVAAMAERTIAEDDAARAAAEAVAFADLERQVGKLDE